MLAARGALQRSGQVSVFATADPLAKELTFAGQGSLRGLPISELWDVIGSKTGGSDHHSARRHSSHARMW